MTLDALDVTFAELEIYEMFAHRKGAEWTVRAFSRNAAFEAHARSLREALETLVAEVLKAHAPPGPVS